MLLGDIGMAKIGDESFGPGNLMINDTAEVVTITFDPRRIIGAFNPSAKAREEGRDGNPKVASTGSYRFLDVSGVRLMLHVIGRPKT